MDNNYNRKELQNKTQQRKKIEEKELKILLALFEDKKYRQLAMLYYGEGYTLEKCAELMFFSKRHTERIKSEMDRIAFYTLLKMATDTEQTMKLLQIKKIIME